ncbi:MAG: STAS domain-containing protein [Eubacterium sp.]|nr:STAS domain-containing protein [Eubacterium sp.]
MTITKTQEGNKLTITLDGRLDTTTSPELETEVRENLGDVKELVFDLEKLEYISSAGLRVLLLAQKTMNKQGEMKVKKANESVMEIFDLTGFSDILTIEGA